MSADTHPAAGRKLIMTQNKTKFRLTLNSFNVIKGIGILTVILGHMASHYKMEELALPLLLLYIGFPVLAGAMPMFFLISGYSFKEKSVKKVLKTSFQSLIKPYLLVTLVFILLYPITFRLWYGEWAYGIHETKLYLIAFLFGIPKPGKQLFGYSIYHCTAMWFFLSTFWATNLLNLILKIKNKSAQLIIVLLLVIAGYEMLIRDFNFYCISQGFMATGYFYLGYMMKKHDLFSRGMHKVRTYLVLVPIACFFGFFCSFNLCLGEFRYGMIDYIASCFAGILLMYLGVYLQRFEGTAMGLFDKIGTYTYWILCIHAVENDCMQWWAYKKVIPHESIAFVGEFVLKIVIIIFCCYLLKKITQYRYSRKRKQQWNKTNILKN